MNRRSALLTSAAAVAAGATTSATWAQATGGVKLTVLYGPPKNPAEFEAYYLSTHIPLVAAVKGIRRLEAAKGVPLPDGSPPAFYRIFEAWFATAEEFARIAASPEWAKVRADTGKIAPEGVTRLVSRLD